MPSYYEIDSSRVTFREYLWETKNPLILLIAAILKLFRVRLPSSSDDPNIDSTLQCVVPELPPEMTARFSSVVAELATLGFHDPVYHLIEDHGTQTRICWASFRHISGRCCARVHHRFWGRGQKKDRGLSVQFITSFTDGTFLVSCSGKPDMAAPATVQVNRICKASVQQLWAEHDRLFNAVLVNKSVQPVWSAGELIAIIERLHVLHRDFHLARGVFRLRNSVEVAKAEAFLAQVEQARAAGLEHPEVMAELTRLQEKKPKWSSALWVLLLSGIAFMAAGAWRWDWKFALWLVPILLFHEFGHWLAMRLFRYRNLRMFFIPLFGAAVTGQNWNVPGWKKALVSLAGPLPGIALGIVLGVIGVIVENQFLKEAALMLIIINAFNLLPVLPLDGGHFLHAILFCRNRWLDIGFRLLAVVGLLSLSAFGFGKLLMGVGIMLAVGLPIAYKMGKITDHFRNQPLVPPHPGEDRIPHATAQLLIGAVKSEMPGGGITNLVAQHTLNIFETLNARPPKAIATIGLLMLYGGSVVASVVFAVFLFISKEGSVGDFFSASMHQPQFSISCGDTESWRGTGRQENSEVNLVVASFEDQESARQEFTQIKARLPQHAEATRFGNSMILSLPVSDDAARETWFQELQRASTNTFVVVSNNTLTLSLHFIAPDATTATNLEEDLLDYFGSPNTASLMPPWSPDVTSAEFAAFRKTRRFWREMKDEIGNVWRDPSMSEYGEKISAATRRGASQEVQKLETEQTERAVELEMQKRKSLHEKYASTPFAKLVDLEAQLNQLNYTNRVERENLLREVAQEMGELKEVAPHHGLIYGHVARSGLLLRSPWITLQEPSENLPALLNWLCKNGCAGVQYEIQNAAFVADAEDWEEP